MPNTAKFLLGVQKPLGQTDTWTSVQLGVQIWVKICNDLN